MIAVASISLVPVNFSRASCQGLLHHAAVPFRVFFVSGRLDDGGVLSNLSCANPSGRPKLIAKVFQFSVRSGDELFCRFCWCRNNSLFRRLL
jgi:hypothetical protein